jgi:hypothetical protein
MKQSKTHNDDDSIVRKDLDDRDRTDGSRSGHYSRADVLDACHAGEGATHE